MLIRMLATYRHLIIRDSTTLIVKRLVGRNQTINLDTDLVHCKLSYTLFLLFTFW